MNFDRRAALTVSLDQLDLCLISTFNSILFISAIPVISTSMSGWKSLELSLSWTNACISFLRSWTSSRVVPKSMYISSCSRIASDLVTFWIHSEFRTMFGTCVSFWLLTYLKTVKSSEICFTTSWSSPISIRSNTSKGCLTKRKMQEPSTSWAVVAKTKDSESKAVPAVAKVVVNDLLRKATAALSAE